MARLDETVRTAKALADRTRVRILAGLAERNLCVCEITALVGVAQPVVSRHLGILRAAGLVEDVRDGRWVEYRLVPQPAGSLAGAALGAIGALRASDPAIAAIAGNAHRVDRRRLRGAAAPPETKGRDPWRSGSRSTDRAAGSATSRSTRRGASSSRGASPPKS